MWVTDLMGAIQLVWLPITLAGESAGSQERRALAWIQYRLAGTGLDTVQISGYWPDIIQISGYWPGYSTDRRALAWIQYRLAGTGLDTIQISRHWPGYSTY